jgi:hypothetical protein
LRKRPRSTCSAARAASPSTSRAGRRAQAELDLVEAAAQFAELATVITAAGVVILSQGLLLDDQRGGLLEWLLSKPLSRLALLLAKLAGHTSGLLAAIVALPCSSWAATPHSCSR